MAETGNPLVEVSAEELFGHLVNGADSYVLCVEDEHSHTTSSCLGRVVPPERVLRVSTEKDALEEAVGRLPEGARAYTVCERGCDAEALAAELRKREIEVARLADGIRSWVELCLVRPLVMDAHLEVHQILRPSLGVLSYVVLSGKSVLVIDPQRFIQPYTHLAAEHRLRVTSVLDTHLHSDHVSGAARVAAVARSPEFLHPFDGVNLIDRNLVHYPFDYLVEGRQYPIGTSRFRVLHLPGHTLGHSGVLLNERYLFCGETLLCRGLPVPDVTCPGGPDWARLLHGSVQRLALLPDDTFVFPGRFTTPACVDAEKGVQARLGDMRDTETLKLAEMGEEAFAERVMELQPQSWGDVHVEILRINARQRKAEDESEITRLEAGAGGFDLPEEGGA